VGVDMEFALFAFRGQLGKGSDGDGELVADAVALDDYGVGRLAEDLSTDVRDHKAILPERVSCESLRTCNSRAAG